MVQEMPRIGFPVVCYMAVTVVWFEYYYAPNFEEVEGAYWFGPVRGSVHVLCLHTVKNG